MANGNSGFGLDGERSDDDSMLHSIIDELLSQGMSEEEAANALGQTIPEITERVGEELLDALKSDAPAMLKDRTSRRARFQRRLQKKWRHPFELLRMLIEVVREAGEEYNSKHRPSAVAENDLVFEALTRLHARACLVAEEVFCLLEGGFASGAQSRWRTLHEITTVSFFIKQFGRDTAERYLLHHIIETCRSADIYQKNCEALGQEPLTAEEMRQHRDSRNELCRRFGDEYRKDWGWAADALGNRNPSFPSIERAVNLDHLRPYVRFSCHPNHASSKGLHYDLGASLMPEDSPMVLAGSSDAGLADPGICTAMSLYQIITNLLVDPETTSLQTLTELGAVKLLSDEAQEAFAAVDAKLAAKAPLVRERLARFESRTEKRPGQQVQDS